MSPILITCLTSHTAPNCTEWRWTDRGSTIRDSSNIYNDVELKRLKLAIDIAYLTKKNEIIKRRNDILADELASVQVE